MALSLNVIVFSVFIVFLLKCLCVGGGGGGGGGRRRRLSVRPSAVIRYRYIPTWESRSPALHEGGARYCMSRHEELIKFCDPLIPVLKDLLGEPWRMKIRKRQSLSPFSGIIARRWTLKLNRR